MIDIKDTSNITRFSTPINEGAKRKFLLMKEDYITLKFSVDNPVYFKLGDYVDESFGLFELVDLCKPTVNSTTGGYDYELRLDAYYWKWKNKRLFYSPEVGGSEAGWNLTATLDVHMKVFLRNLVTLGYTHKGTPFSFEIDSTVELSSKLVSYDNTNLIDALTRIAETWECEWWITDSIIHFGRCESGDPVDFDLEANVSSMSRSDSKTSYATRVYAFGSTRNIPSTYRKNLIFDVKEETSGRWIKDTARKLESKFFPESSLIEEKYSVSLGYNVLFTRTLSYTCKIADELVIGKYKLECSGVKFNISTVNGINQPVVYFPKGAYFFNIEFRYKLNGSQRKRTVGSDSVIVGANEKSSISLTVKLEDYINIESKTTDCEFEVYISTPSDSIVQAIANNEGAAIVRMEGISASTSVTFLTGLNSGKTFDAIYNPYFTTGDEANVLMLPERGIASVGDTYMIDNIVKSKVPTGYFSKSNTELTVEGVVTNRLMLPAGTNCVNAYEDMSQEEAIEDIVIFEEVYPRRIGTMEEVNPHSHEETIKEDGKAPVIEKWDAYRFKDSKLTFSKEYVLPGQELEIVFQSGALNGMRFVVAFNPFEKGIDTEAQPDRLPDGSCNPAAQVFEIKRNEDYGRPLPDSIAYPGNGDKYILSGFNPEFVLDTMIPNAEKELLEKAQEYVDKSKIDPSTYDCKMMPTSAYNDGEVKLFSIGDRVNLINKAYFDNGRQSRIIGFEYPLDIPYDSPIYTVGETAAYSRLGALEEKIDSLTFKGQTYTGSVGGGSSSGGSSSSEGGSTDSKLLKDILVTAPKTGYFNTGNTIAAGQTWEEIFRKMLYEPSQASLQGSLSTSNDVEYGSNKGIITYTATRNGQGPMKKSYYDNVESNALVFSGNANGVQTAVRQLSGVNTQAESYFATVVYAANGELPEVTLNNKISVNVRRRWFAGLCSTVPTTSAQVRALSGGGLYTGAGSYKFQVDKFKTLAICIPSGDIKEITLTAYPGNFIEDTGVCKGPTLISVEGANGSIAVEYKMWVISTEMINDADTFTFKTN